MSPLDEADLVYDPFSPEVMSNPAPFYKRLREKHPIYYIEKYDSYFFSRFDDIMEMMTIGDNTLLSTEQSIPTPDYLLKHRNTGALPFASSNPMAPGTNLPSPYYEEMRLAHIAPLRPRAVAELQEFVRTLCRERLALLLPRRKFDLTTEYAGIVAASVVLHLFGMPLSHAADLLDVVNEMSRFNPLTNSVNATDSYTRLTGFILPAIAKRRAAGADGSNGLIDGLINYRTKPDGRALNDQEVLNQLVCAMMAGTESAPKIAAHGILELQQRPDQLKEIRADLENNVPIAVNEIVRYCAPIQYAFRTAHKDVTIAGQQIKAGQRVVALFYSAARDDREFKNPDMFIWNRSIPRTLTFGYGQKHCIGKHVALLEIKIAVQEFLSRVNSFHFVMEEAVRNPSYFQWGWNNLPVVIERTNP